MKIAKLKLKYNDEEHTLTEWAKIKKIPYRYVYQRFKRGLPPERIFFNGITNKKIEREADKLTIFTQSAKECYTLGCTCSKCMIVPDFFKRKCRMKYSVRELVKKYGAPDIKEYKDINKDET